MPHNRRLLVSPPHCPVARTIAAFSHRRRTARTIAAQRTASAALLGIGASCFGLLHRTAVGRRRPPGTLAPPTSNVVATIPSVDLTDDNTDKNPPSKRSKKLTSDVWDHYNSYLKLMSLLQRIPMCIK
ncbi:hypothetical protein GUJ93_ZPchr0001g31811 [Zizania palustris]|uniref:Uncharacterized protein n=1 Tax=Zizania palustris TaxID=103762 RepID=A0A8J5RMZ4_ZIZPA|nr:hypothetical protein GUJ93_ZPchr0001g31811 [Zizania palustris]